jgi:hypothetical protein
MIFQGLSEFFVDNSITFRAWRQGFLKICKATEKSSPAKFVLSAKILYSRAHSAHTLTGTQGIGWFIAVRLGSGRACRNALFFFLPRLEANIVKARTNRKLVDSKDENYRACVSIGAVYFVNFGDPDALRPELQTRQQTKRQKELPFCGLRVSDLRPQARVGVNRALLLDLSRYSPEKT